MMPPLAWLLVASLLIFLAGVVAINALRSSTGVEIAATLSVAGLVTAMVCLILLGIQGVFARDLGQWEGHDAATREWFKHLMRPDFPDQPCCGEADGYWCEDIHIRDGKTYCSITDDRPDEPLLRPHIDVGTVIEIPNEKLKWSDGNPTGHSIVFLGGGSGYAKYVFCFVQGSGI